MPECRPTMLRIACGPFEKNPDTSSCTRSSTRLNRDLNESGIAKAGGRQRSPSSEIWKGNREAQKIQWSRVSLMSRGTAFLRRAGLVLIHCPELGEDANSTLTLLRSMPSKMSVPPLLSVRTLFMLFFCSTTLAGSVNTDLPCVSVT